MGESLEEMGTIGSKTEKEETAVADEDRAHSSSPRPAFAITETETPLFVDKPDTVEFCLQACKSSNGLSNIATHLQVDTESNGPSTPQLWPNTPESTPLQSPRDNPNTGQIFWVPVPVWVPVIS